MQDITLLKKISIYQKIGDKDILEELILKFTPLLKKYSIKSSKSSFEDSMQDLIVTFIEILNKIPLNKFNEDKYILSYISKSIKNKHISLLSENFKENLFYYDENLLKNKLKFYDLTERIELLELFKILSIKEQRILYLIYFVDMSIVNIANKYKTSRQNINQIKLCSLKKLKKYIENKLKYIKKDQSNG